jgi:hypothetical protein
MVVVVPTLSEHEAATTQLFRASSRERNSCRPNMWQIEFTENVACW